MKNKSCIPGFILISTLTTLSSLTYASENEEEPVQSEKREPATLFIDKKTKPSNTPQKLNKLDFQEEFKKGVSNPIPNYVPTEESVKSAPLKESKVDFKEKFKEKISKPIQDYVPKEEPVKMAPIVEAPVKKEAPTKLEKRKISISDISKTAVLVGGSGPTFEKYSDIPATKPPIPVRAKKIPPPIPQVSEDSEQK